MSGAELAGQVALVTGAATGLGYHLAAGLGRRGAHVVLCDIAAELAQAETELTGAGLAVEQMPCDVRDADQVRAVVDAVLDGHGRLDVLINNAGVARRTSVLDPWAQAVADYDEIMAVNSRGTFLFGLAAAAAMAEAGGGNIINIATDHIHTCGWPEPVPHLDGSDCEWEHQPRPPGGSADLDVYDASKWSLNGFTQGWAKSLRPYGVRVNAICMGATDTPMVRAAMGEVPAEISDRWLAPQEVAGVAIALIEEGPEGRSGDNIGLWLGHRCALPAPSPVLDVRGR